MNDDWKGEHFILRKPTKAEQLAETHRVNSLVGHERRRQDGSNVSRSAEPWARQLRSEYMARRFAKPLALRDAQ